MFKHTVTLTFLTLHQMSTPEKEFTFKNILNINFHEAYTFIFRDFLTIKNKANFSDNL